MLLLQPPQLLSILFTLLTATHTTHARPKISDELRELLESRYHYLSKRQCANPCGWSGQVCCGSDQSCSTNTLGQAVCLSGSGGGGSVALAADAPGAETYTTTIVESGVFTRTTTYSRSFGAQQTSAAAAQVSGITCSLDMGEKPCGSICCATGQYCVYAGQCGASADQADESSSSVLGQVFTPTATNTAPLRPTSNAAFTVTTKGSVTTTVAFTAPTSAKATSTAAGGAAGVTESNNGLSGGAIAGIVVGVLVGIILLILLIFCCCAATVGNAILTALGCGRRRKRKTEVTYIEEHGHHHSGGGGPPPRRWYGLLPARVEERKKKKSGVGGLTAVAGGLGALAVVLGLKRKSDKKKTEYSGSSYYSDYSYYDSSESSSDRYTRRTGRSGSRR